jgi:hypothetical protein
MSMESMSVMTAAMNESMLQSYDGTIRVFPSFPDTRKGRFTLHAAGGFVISSESEAGKVRWILVRSLAGNECRLILPWDKADWYDTTKGKTQHMEGNTAIIKTKPGQSILILPAGTDIKQWIVEPEEPVENSGVRYHPSGKTRLGIPAMY